MLRTPRWAKSSTLLVLGVLFLLPVKSRAVIEESAISILLPTKNVIIKKGTLSLIGSVADPTLKGVNVLVNGSPKRLAKVKNGHFFAKMELTKGLSRIEVIGEEKNVGGAVIEVFYQAPGTAVPDDVAMTFEPFYTHQKVEGEDDCENCHDLSAGSYNKMRRGVIECANDICHKDRSAQAFDYVHGPVATGACNACHTPHGSELKYELTAAGASLCYRCHTDKEMEFAREFIHGPVGGGDCSACHEPHGSQFPFQLRRQGSDLCYMCHQGNKAEGQFVHGPVAAGDCNVCHNPHGSSYRYQLEAEGAELCFMCHVEKQMLLEQEYVHPPVAKGLCIKCHDAHSSDYKFQLEAQNGPELCNEFCHEGDYKKGINVKYPHPPVAQGKCTACHDPHATDIKFHLHREGSELCFGCHTQKRTEVQKRYPHGPVIQGDCVACHDPHGTEFIKLLRKYFPPQFYTPFDVTYYELCFNCHQKTLTLDEFTTTLTDFRNGSQSLHYIHVNKKKKGRTCRACHNIHASDQEKHIRFEIPFSEYWSYKISFKKSETGGRCVVGCHKPRAYDRENPVDRSEWY